jgi:predicted nucleic-acid-binding Zn-ribbon protein
MAYNTIDTDYGIGSILSNFDQEYINHIISDSLEMRFRPFNGPMPNMVDVLNRQFELVKTNSPDYMDKILDVQNETYINIINTICQYYNLTFTLSNTDNLNIREIYNIARTLYEIFVSQFTINMNNFFVSYIIRNADSIYSYLEKDPSAKKPKDSGIYAQKNYIDPKFILIHANLKQVVINMASYDITLHQLLSYMLDPNSAAIIGNMLVDNNDIYKNYYASYIMDKNTMAGVLTNIKLLLQSKTFEQIQIETK